MNYDFYARLWNENKINSFIKESMKRRWEVIWQNHKIHFNKKEKKFKETMKNHLLNDLYYNLIEVNSVISINTYFKFLKEMETYLKQNNNKLNKFTNEKLTKESRGKKYTPQLPNEFVKDVYKNNIKNYSNFQNIKLLDSLNIFNKKRNLPNSILISIIFSLETSYISKDDEEFYVIDNPICKDKVFKTPLVRPSSWKGALRYSAMKNVLKKKEDLEKVETRIIMLRLFGNEKKSMRDFLDVQFGDELKNEYKKKLKEIYDDENLNLRGRLVFYPTFFDQIGLDVITPHNRGTKTPAKGPIYFETVLPETNGIFYLLYFPFDLIDKEEKINAEQKEDLTFLTNSIIDMFDKYGFGAKTTSGYGIVKSKIKFKINDNPEKEGTFEDFKEHINDYTGVN